MMETYNHLKFRIVQLRDEINRLKEEIKELKRPSEIALTADPTNRVKFYLSFAFLVPLSCFLYLFYVSAGSAAFFTNFAQEFLNSKDGDLSSLFHAIFNPKALVDAVKSGNVLLLLFPSIFFALGFLLHRLLEHKKILKFALFSAFTFVLDGLIAFQISGGLHQMRVLSGVAEGSWTLARAVISPKFWLVISCGFVVYIIWSLLLNRYFEAYKKLHPVYSANTLRKEAIADREKQIRKLESQKQCALDEVQQAKEQLEHQLQENKREIEQWQRRADSDSVSWQELNRRINLFVSGWQLWEIQNSITDTQAQGRMEAVKATVDEFRTEIMNGFTGAQATDSIEVQRDV